MHVGDMVCHVLTCMAHVKAINMELFVQGGGSKKENKGKKKEGEGKKGKKERKRKEREKEKKGREKEGEKESGVLVKPRSKVRIFDEGCTTRGRFPPTPVHFTPKGRVGA